MTRRQQDVEVEKLVADRLDAFYKSKGIQFQRVTDAQSQFRGIDLVLTSKSGKSVNVDEKCKWRGLQNGEKLNSYSFEVNRLCKDGVRRNGWFVDKSNLTDLYCFAFPQVVLAEDGTPTAIEPSMKVELFSKADIKAIVAAEAPYDDIEVVGWHMAQNDVRLKKYHTFALYKTPSFKLREEPVNLLISPELIHATPHFRRFYA